VRDERYRQNPKWRFVEIANCLARHNPEIGPDDAEVQVGFFRGK
jgi:hypothetical protein